MTNDDQSFEVSVFRDFCKAKSKPVDSSKLLKQGHSLTLSNWSFDPGDTYLCQNNLSEKMVIPSGFVLKLSPKNNTSWSAFEMGISLTFEYSVFSKTKTGSIELLLQINEGTNIKKKVPDTAAVVAENTLKKEPVTQESVAKQKKEVSWQPTHLKPGGMHALENVLFELNLLDHKLYELDNISPQQAISYNNELQSLYNTFQDLSAKTEEGKAIDAIKEESEFNHQLTGELIVKTSTDNTNNDDLRSTNPDDSDKSSKGIFSKSVPLTSSSIS